jgi:hypothetical protein
MKLYQVVGKDGNIHACYATKKAAQAFSDRWTGLSVVKATPGFCPVHRVEHHEYDATGKVVK